MEISKDDVRIIEAEFNEIVDKPEGMTIGKLISFMRWRIYTEWCMGDGLRVRPGATRATHGEYHGEGYTNWINQETHLLLEQRGGAQSHDEYLQVRAAIVRAATRRSNEMYGAWNGLTYPLNGDRSNLRTSLTEYLKQIA